MVRSPAAEELAIMELGELLCALNIVSGSQECAGGKEAEPIGAERQMGRWMELALNLVPRLPCISRPMAAHVTWDTVPSLPGSLSPQDAH